MEDINKNVNLLRNKINGKIKKADNRKNEILRLNLNEKNNKRLNLRENENSYDDSKFENHRINLR